MGNVQRRGCHHIIHIKSICMTNFDNIVADKK